jgi:hypothetical protein
VVSCYIEREIVKISFFFDLQLPPLCFWSFSVAQSRKKTSGRELLRFLVRPLDPNFKRKVVKDKKTRGEEPVRKDAKEENRKRTDGRNRRHDFSELKFV